MTEHNRGPSWHARTMAIPDPGPLDSYLPAHGGQAWLRRGDGMIGLGSVARFETRDIASADAWWRAFTNGVDHENGLPRTWGTGPLAFGSFVFDPAHSALASVLTVPHTVLGRRKGRSWITTVTPPGSAQPPAPAPQPPATAPSEVDVVPDGLSPERWMAAVREAVSRIEAAEVSKVVLARSLRARAAAPLDARWLVTQLAQAYPTCWTFLIDSMVGASPEMLLRRENGLVTSRVLAGTIKRAGSEQTDLALAASLARSSKNLIEHEIAVDSVAAALEPFCSGMNVPESPFVLELANVMHLASDVTGVADHDTSALDIVAKLHPSAAVCGAPTDKARALIAELEHLDRGRYAGPVGWIDAHGDGEWAIALRCGALDPEDGHQIRLYAGSGIVAGSDPAEELAETDAKFEPMLAALGLNPCLA